MVTHVDPSMKEEQKLEEGMEETKVCHVYWRSAESKKVDCGSKEGDQKFELYQEEMEHVKVCYVQ